MFTLTPYFSIVFSQKRHLHIWITLSYWSLYAQSEPNMWEIMDTQILGQESWTSHKKIKKTNKQKNRFHLQCLVLNHLFFGCQIIYIIFPLTPIQYVLPPVSMASTLRINTSLVCHYCQLKWANTLRNTSHVAFYTWDGVLYMHLYLYMQAFSCSILQYKPLPIYSLASLD